MTLWIAISADTPPYQAFRLWMIGGLAVLAVWFHWLPQVAANHLEVSMMSGAIVALLAVMWDALRFGVFGYLVAKLRARGVESTFVWPTVWVSLEWLWPHLFPWRIGQSQLGCLPLCQIAEFTGAYGVSFLFMWGAAALGELLRAALISTTPAHRRTRVMQTIACGVALAACLGWGMWRMQQFTADSSARLQLRFALVQPGARDDEMLSRLQAMSREAAGRADLVAWGESTVGDFSLDLSSFACAAEVHDHARDGAEAEQPCPALGRPLLCGGCSFAPGTSETGPYQNTAFLIAADETIIGRYHKRVLMPWGEYAVGQQWIPGLRDLLGSVDSLVAGDSATPLLLAEDARLGVLICYEDIMPHPARQTVLEGANVLVNLNNLSVFGRTAALRQHQHLARFRAIENRRWLVRCGTTGSTAAIDATGRVESQAPTNTPASLVVTARLVDTITFYTGWGDVFAGLSVLTSLILWARPDRRCIRDASGIHPAQKSRRDSDTN